MLDYQSHLSPLGLIKTIELLLADLLIYAFHICCLKEIGNLRTSDVGLVLLIIFLTMPVYFLSLLLHVPTHILQHIPHLFPAQKTILICIVLIEELVQQLSQFLLSQCLFFLPGVLNMVAITHLIESVPIFLVSLMVVMLVALGDIVITLRLRLRFTRAYSHFLLYSNNCVSDNISIKNNGCYQVRPCSVSARSVLHSCSSFLIRR